MAFSKEMFIDSFVEETREHLTAINNCVISLKEKSKDEQTITEILRHLHTIKGSARMLDFKSIENLSHSIEDVYKSINDDSLKLTNNIILLTHEVTKKIDKIADYIIEERNDKNIDISEYLTVCKQATEGFFFSLESLQGEASEGLSFGDENEELDIKNSFDSISSIRIDISKINQIIQSFDDLIIKQFKLKHQIENLEKRIADDTKPPLKELPRQLKEDLSIAENAVFESQHELFELRMLPLDMILTPLKNEILTDALKVNKEIKIDIPQTSIMMDKIILEQLRIVLLHLIRNSIDHGIEDAETREKAGKTKEGLISVHAVQLSSKILITVKDDGQGIQYSKIREKALKLFTGKKSEIDALSDKDLQQYIFAAGFSTASETTHMSGRGMGLDIVRNSMEKIKGKIKINSEQGKGTSFELTIPLTLATQRGLFVYTGSTKVMIPSHYLQKIITAVNDRIITIQNQTYISNNNKLIPLYYLSSILETEKTKNINSVIIIEYLETQIALVVDSIQQHENVIITPLPKLLKEVKSLQGVVYDENYSIIPILDIPSLMQKMHELVVYDIKKYQTKNRKRSQRILIVEDSPTTRMIEQTIFENSGYQTALASDGIEALDILKEIHIDAIVMDIQMPRMDGKTFLKNLHRMEEYAELPVVILSSAIDVNLKQEMIAYNVSTFIAKSDFERGALLSAVKEILDDK